MDFALQQEICQKYGVAPFATSELLKVGISQSVLDRILPINGLRHPPEGDSSGWYLWAGEGLSQDENFFSPVHICHLFNLVPSVVKYLLLPPGYRFLIIPLEYEDVWQDEALLKL